MKLLTAMVGMIMSFHMSVKKLARQGLLPRCIKPHDHPLYQQNHNGGHGPQDGNENGHEILDEVSI